MERRECNATTDVKENWCEGVENTYIAFCCEYGSESTFSRKREKFWVISQLLKVCLL